MVDAQGRIHSQVYGDRMTAEALGVPLRELILSAPPAGEVPTFDELVERVRIPPVYDADTGEYRYDWKLLLEIFGGLALSPRRRLPLARVALAAAFPHPGARGGTPAAIHRPRPRARPPSPR
ncbi:MAG: hypothetical protein IPM99_06785 [Rubrivivax sp.]|nr:hypothetical protein [Rubrivivax sp.]